MLCPLCSYVFRVDWSLPIGIFPWFSSISLAWCTRGNLGYSRVTTSSSIRFNSDWFISERLYSEISDDSTLFTYISGSSDTYASFAYLFSSFRFYMCCFRFYMCCFRGENSVMETVSCFALTCSLSEVSIFSLSLASCFFLSRYSFSRLSCSFMLMNNIIRVLLARIMPMEMIIEIPT